MYCPEGDCTQFWYKHYFDDFCAQPVLNTTHPSTTKHEISDTAANLPTALGLAPIVSAIVSLYLMCICSLLERMWSHCHIARVQQTFATATMTRPQITAAIPLSASNYHVSHLLLFHQGEKCLEWFVRKAWEWLEEVLFRMIFEWERESPFLCSRGESGQHFLWAKQESDSRRCFFWKSLSEREKVSFMLYHSH